jgi:FkbM family methyltransferase
MNLLHNWWHKLRLYVRAAFITRSINWRGLPLIPKQLSATLPRNRASYNEFVFWIRNSIRLDDPRIIFDVGANHGVFAQAASTCFPDAMVFLFEPLPSLRPALESLAAHYRDRWRFQSMALGACTGHLPFHIDPADDGIGSFVGFSESYDDLYRKSHTGALPGRVPTTVDIPIETLDNFCECQGIEQIDLIKIDVEGFEFAVLDGASKMLPNTAAIIVETSLVRTGEGKPAPLSNMISRLTNAGFYIVALYPSFAQDLKQPLRPCEYNILARRFES